MPRKPRDPDLPDFYRQEWYDPVVSAGRRRFFEAIASQAHEVLDDLRDCVLPVAMRAFSEGRTFEVMWSAVTEWANRYHFRPHQNLWVPEHGLHCIFAWNLDTESAQRLDISKTPTATPESLGFSLTAGKFEFVLDDGWKFGSESWEQFAQRAETQLHRRLKSYRTSAKKTASDLGYSPTVRKRRRSADSLQVHYEWLVLRVCKRLAYDCVAERYNASLRDAIDGDAVRKAVSRTASAIGFSLADRT